MTTRNILNGARHLLSRAKTDHSGFTLIEIMVASAIASIIILMVYSSYKSILTTIKRSTGTADFYENLNLAINKIDLDISNAYFNPNNKKTSFIATLEGENSRMSLVTVSHNDVRMSGNPKVSFPVSDVHEVGYLLRRDRETRDLYKLIYREKTHFDDNPDQGGDENVLLENVISLRFDFQMGNDWIAQWDSRQNNKYPSAVRTTIVVRNYQKKEERFEFLSLVNLKRQ